VGTLLSPDPQNWVAPRSVFLGPGKKENENLHFGKPLSSGAHPERGLTKAHNAGGLRSRRLYQFSQNLLSEGNVISAEERNKPNYIVDSFEAGASELFLPHKDKFYSFGPRRRVVCEQKTKTAFLRATNDRIETRHRILHLFLCFLVCVPSQLLGISVPVVSGQRWDAVSILVAIAIERATSIEQFGTNGSGATSERLKSSAGWIRLLHEFPDAPLTSMKAAVDDLLGSPVTDHVQGHETADSSS